MSYQNLPEPALLQSGLFLARLTQVYTLTSSDVAPSGKFAGMTKGTNLYSFVEQTKHSVTGLPVDATPGRQSYPVPPATPTSAFAIEVNNTPLTVPDTTPDGYTNPGPYVWMRERETVGSVPVYEFAFAAPATSASWVSPATNVPSLLTLSTNTPPYQIQIQVYSAWLWPTSLLGPIVTQPVPASIPCWLYIPPGSYTTDSPSTGWLPNGDPLTQPASSPPTQISMPPQVGAWYSCSLIENDPNGIPIYGWNSPAASQQSSGDVTVGLQQFAGTKIFDYPSNLNYSVAAMGGLGIGTATSTGHPGAVQAFQFVASNTFVTYVPNTSSIALDGGNNFYIGSPVSSGQLNQGSDMFVWIRGGGTDYQGASGMDGEGNIFVNGICVTVGGLGGSPPPAPPSPPPATVGTIDGGVWI